MEKLRWTCSENYRQIITLMPMSSRFQSPTDFLLTGLMIMQLTVVSRVLPPPTDMKYYEQPSNFLTNNKLSGAPEFVPINNIGPSSPKLP